jgi:hypothetical protein
VLSAGQEPNQLLEREPSRSDTEPDATCDGRRQGQFQGRGGVDEDPARPRAARCEHGDELPQIPLSKVGSILHPGLELANLDARVADELVEPVHDLGLGDRRELLDAAGVQIDPAIELAVGGHALGGVSQHGAQRPLSMSCEGVRRRTGAAPQSCGREDQSCEAHATGSLRQQKENRIAALG